LQHRALGILCGAAWERAGRPAIWGASLKWLHWVLSALFLAVCLTLAVVVYYLLLSHDYVQTILLIVVFYLMPFRGYATLREILWLREHGVPGHARNQLPWFVKVCGNFWRPRSWF
jgi:hypothetical protein